ncbi:MAG: helix-turn-helix transcriptional regulator, partial [Actinomycetota bacterium]|nr:helix-turn-helix transcriptional regulator [Actinomycetota bacterium]
SLRALERDGLVHSTWEVSDTGPDRRIYQLTRPGMEELHRRVRAIAGTRRLMDAFLGRYEEFVALARESEPRRASR